MNFRENCHYRIAALILSVSILVIGCNSLSATPINRILENPREYSGKTVTISGKVTEVFSLVFVKYFVVEDKTAEIVVVTNKPLPREGTKIMVKGTVEEAFSIGDKQLVVIVEEEAK